MPVQFRRNFFPKNCIDWISFLFFFSTIIMFYWFEFFYVLRQFYFFSSSWRFIHLMVGTFTLMNIISNFISMTVIDTSIFTINLAAFQESNLVGWSYCEICEIKTPPRCWHCKVCNCCILKRDHHCTLAGCCVGYHNQRFFLVFLVYFFIFCCYSMYLNMVYVLPQTSIDFTFIFQIICPLLVILIDFQHIRTHIFIILLVLNLTGLIISSYFLHLQFCLLFSGSVLHEYRNGEKNKYNFGLLKNITNTFGRRWYLVWISGFIDSTLPLNGGEWTVRSEDEKKNI